MHCGDPRALRHARPRTPPLGEALGVRSHREMMPMQPGDVKDTYAEIEAAQLDLGFKPSVDLHQGIPLFVEWYLKHYPR